MTFRFNATPAHFQSVLQWLLDAEPNQPRHAFYLDDMSLGAMDVATNWRDTLEALRHLIQAEFPISAWKMQLLWHVLNILVVVLSSIQYHIGCKVLKKLFGSQLQTTTRELQCNVYLSVIPKLQLRMWSVWYNKGSSYMYSHMAPVPCTCT